MKIMNRMLLLVAGLMLCVPTVAHADKKPTHPTEHDSTKSMKSFQKHQKKEQKKTRKSEKKAQKKAQKKAVKLREAGH